MFFFFLRYQCPGGHDPDDRNGQCRNCNHSTCGRSEHRPNFVVAQWTCSDCENASDDQQCETCGTRCSECGKKEKKTYLSGPCPGTCGLREKIFFGPRTAFEFCNWLFDEKHSNSVVLAHNMKGYDGVFILRYLVENGTPPRNIVYNGSKIMCMNIGRGLNMRFIDSLNFFQMPLSRLPKTFGLTELKKGYFPHFFNRPENQSYIGPYPPPGAYGADQMPVSERRDFLQWHDRLSEQVFDFAREMEEYCRSDVTILKQACLKFKDLIGQATEGTVDPFDYATVASMCMAIFRTCHLKEDLSVRLGRATELLLPQENGQVLYEGVWYTAEELRERTGLLVPPSPASVVRPVRDEGYHPAHYQAGALIVAGDRSETDLDVEALIVVEKRFLRSPIAVLPYHGYRRLDRYSLSSIRWLEWVAHTRQLDMQHALRGSRDHGSRDLSPGRDPWTRDPSPGRGGGGGGGGGEARLPGTRLRFDGLAGQRVFEFLGCLWHGCPKCYPEDRTTLKLPGTGQCAAELYELTKQREEKIRQAGYDYESIWEHDYHCQLREDSVMQDFVDSLDLQPPLDPRDSFFGGRTNAIRLHYEVKKKKNNGVVRFLVFLFFFPLTQPIFYLIQSAF